MYKKILAAVNEYTNSQAAARYAIGLARVSGARLSLVFVVEQGMSLESLRLTEAALERLFLEAGAKGVEVESVVQHGDPFRHLAALVRERGVDLVFAATRREDMARRYFTRTLSQRLMLHLPCSVALVRVVHPAHITPRQILAPFRGYVSHLEEKAFFVAKLAQAFGAAVTLFHAPRSLTGFFRGKEPKPDERDLKGLEKFAQRLKSYEVATRTRVRRGPAAHAITIEAAAEKNDLIIMGASERGLLESLMSGDPVEEVLRETPANLIILLPRLKAA